MDHIATFTPSAPRLPWFNDKLSTVRTLQSDSAQPTLLYVGSDVPHRNLTVVAEGLRQIPESLRPQWYVTLPQSAAVCRTGIAISLGTLDRSELCDAYRAATILVMPSLTETVGLPMLEAMRVGTSVLAADRPYAHAVCEDAAAFFDPTSPEDFVAKVMHLISDDGFRRDMVRRGHAIVTRRDASDPYRSMLEKAIAVAERTSCELTDRDRV